MLLCKFRLGSNIYSVFDDYIDFESVDYSNYHMDLILASSFLSYQYAYYVLKGPFPEGEPIIATDATYSRRYAFDVLKGRFHLGEPAIATDGWQSARYACELLNAPFPLGEAAIHSDPDALNYYLNHVVFNK